jgi:septal ring factor EnvC (AmiA/AmiB activator)
MEEEEAGDEVSKLRATIRQLDADNKTLKAQLIDQQEKSDNIVAKLRSYRLIDCLSSQYFSSQSNWRST